MSETKTSSVSIVNSFRIRSFVSTFFLHSPLFLFSSVLPAFLRSSFFSSFLSLFLSSFLSSFLPYFRLVLGWLGFTSLSLASLGSGGGGESKQELGSGQAKNTRPSIAEFRTTFESTGFPKYEPVGAVRRPQWQGPRRCPASAPAAGLTRRSR